MCNTLPNIFSQYLAKPSFPMKYCRSKHDYNALSGYKSLPLHARKLQASCVWQADAVYDDWAHERHSQGIPTRKPSQPSQTSPTLRKSAFGKLSSVTYKSLRHTIHAFAEKLTSYNITSEKDEASYNGQATPCVLLLVVVACRGDS